MVDPTWAGETFPVKLYPEGLIDFFGQLTFVTDLSVLAVAFVEPATVEFTGAIAAI